MRDSRLIEPANEYEEWLLEFDRRDIDAADPRSQWALKYRSRLQRALRALADLPEGAVVLEAGCSQANASLLAAERGLRAVGLDREWRALAYARRKHERGDLALLCGQAEQLPLADVTCAAVLALEILEHLPDPSAALREMWRVLRPGGRLIISTPNADFAHERLPSYARRPPTQAAGQGADAEGHLFAFTLAELRELVRSAGLVVCAAGYEGSMVMSDRLCLNRILPPATLLRLSRLLNRCPGARFVSYGCFVAATRAEEPGPTCGAQ